MLSYCQKVKIPPGKLGEALIVLLFAWLDRGLFNVTPHVAIIATHRSMIPSNTLGTHRTFIWTRIYVNVPTCVGPHLLERWVRVPIITYPGRMKAFHMQHQTKMADPFRLTMIANACVH